ncbi:MAG: ArsJ-associated glyceraldehyde-3-phosphate dehydrogenase [Actinobacteria bacterium]|nr:ArsJ-associated glyceraldehyde-3-phosphate dehydrogenase [Actinomycetota bacterium]
MGRLALRALWDWPELEVVQINEVAGDCAAAAHLMNFDSVHGRWRHEARVDAGALVADGRTIQFSGHADPGNVPWREQGIDIVMESTGQFRTPETIQPFFDCGVDTVVVAAPVKQGALNIVVGVNDDLYDPERDKIVTAASCTTNCLAPIVKVIHQAIGIQHGSITTLHDMTGTQSVVDSAHADLRRARAASLSLIPTTTGSASAIGMIFPELEGRLDGLAVRVPLMNASLTDCVFELARPTDVDEVNSLLASASEAGPLVGILGYEERPLVSVDFKGDARSAIVDARSTLVTNGTQVKILAWYDNEWGYANRWSELARTVAGSISRA